MMNNKAQVKGYWGGVIFGLLIVVLVTFFVWTNEGRLVIQKNFKPELDQCNSQLAKGLEACPVVQCKDSPSATPFMIMGFVLGLAGVLFYGFSIYWSNKINPEVDKKKEEIDKLSKDYDQIKLIKSHAEEDLEDLKKEIKKRAKK